jgi:hypothetical protein
MDHTKRLSAASSQITLSASGYALNTACGRGPALASTLAISASVRFIGF